MDLIALNDNIIVQVYKEEQAENVTQSGFILPGKKTQELRKDIARVISIGKGRYLNNGQLLAPGVQVDDIILFNRFAGTEIILNGEDYLILKESDIMAIVKNS